MLAAAAAKLLGRRLVLPEYFDAPFPASFGECQHCIRPYAFYYNISRLRSYVPLATLEDLYEWLEAEGEGSLRVKVVCKRGMGRCMKEPPSWLRHDFVWDSSVAQLQHLEDPSGLTPVSSEALRSLRTACEEIIWLDTSFRLLSLGDFRSWLDGNELSVSIRRACHGCEQQCQSIQHNEQVQREGWCAPSCRRSPNPNPEPRNPKLEA